MRLLVWNMGGGFGSSEARHERAWRYLEKQDFDVALLQETRKPPAWAHERWASLVWKPKYSHKPWGMALWGCAVVGRSTELQEYQPNEGFPWLQALEGSTAIARSTTDPRWLASVHFHASKIPVDVLAGRSVEGVVLTTPDKSVWEANVIPHELQRLFADETFVWGGDFNSDPRMDERPAFLGGNRWLFDVYAESGLCDTRARFHDSYQQTYFKAGKGEYQLDHVFADAQTEQRVTCWRVDAGPATQQEPYSDHAPILVTLDATV
jgi:endonuclease/exonuclease/phosphatase family metal-dependent hydrolase